MSDWQPVYDDNRDGSDNGRSVESLVDQIDNAADPEDMRLARLSWETALNLHTLTVPQLQVVVLKGLFGVTTEERLAAIIGCTQQAVNRINQRIRKKFQKI